MQWRTDWIIAISSSESNGVVISRFLGTEDEAKALLVDLVKKDKENDPDAFDYGTEDVSEVDDTRIELNAYAVYSTYHVDYTAKKFCDVEFL